MTTLTRHPYVITNSQILGGEPIIIGTRTPVRAIVGDLGGWPSRLKRSQSSAAPDSGSGFRRFELL